MAVYVQSIHDPKLKFKVNSINKETKVAKLQGELSEFEEPLTKERMEKYGYVLKKEDD